MSASPTGNALGSRVIVPPWDKQERRRHPRKLMATAVDFRFELPSGRIFGSGKSVNISRSGVCFRCEHFIPVATVFELSVAANGRRIDVEAQLVYILKVPRVPLYQCGAKFLRLEK